MKALMQEARPEKESKIGLRSLLENPCARSTALPATL
jgi:hypothetical protein